MYRLMYYRCSLSSTLKVQYLELFARKLASAQFRPSEK